MGCLRVEGIGHGMFEGSIEGMGAERVTSAVSKTVSGSRSRV